MSAESSRQRQASQTVVLPQPVTDKSIIDSVAGFIHEVVPPAYTNVLHGENKERITWARFERPDLFDPFIFSESADIDAYENAPLLLIVGYNVGAKIWSISINGEATEVLSLTDSVIKCLRLLPTPLSYSVSESCRKQDLFAHKRPLVALCDNAGSSIPFCLVNFISLRTGEQVKAIQFKTQVCDIQANRRSIAIVFPERIAVFDAFTLEDQLTVTTCFPSPSINPNPVALGSRWLAYAEKQLILQKRSRGGSEGEGVQSYTATVLQAAKTLSKGLRDFSGSVTSSLTGAGPVINGNNSAQPGIITILDVESSHGKSTKDKKGGEIIAHFIAHSEPIVAMNFDPSGMLLITADKRGHRFHVFRINPHVAGSASASVHHLYILHRGDTTARVQDISFSNDSRWVAVSSLRGTTHVFPITPYGGAVGLRTHATPHVVNKLSRFHRSAGLTNDGRNSPILNECNQQLQMLAIPNPCLPPFPSPVVITPLAQLRTYPPGIPATRGHEDVTAMIKVSACFAPPRAWLSSSRETILNNKSMKRAVDSLFIITCHANLIQYDLEPKHVVGVTKDRICDNTQIELGVEAKAEWPLVNSSSNIQPPLNANNPLLLMSRPFISNSSKKYQNLDADERWLSQVEIVTHAGPHRRLWMGPQFVFKTFSASQGVAVPVMDSESGSRLNRSSPVNMPLSHNPIVPVLLESGSSSSFEQSPCLLDMCGSELEKMEGEGDSRLQEDLADAMQEGPGLPIPSDAGGGSMRARASVMARQVNPLGTVITLSEGVSVAACIKTPDSNRKISKVVCCQEQSSHLPSSFDSPVNLDLSRTHCEPGADLNIHEKIIYIDSTQTSSDTNPSSSSTSVDVNENTSKMVTVVELVSKTDNKTINISKTSLDDASASNEKDNSERPLKSQRDTKNVSKTTEKSRSVPKITTQPEIVAETSSVISSKNLKCDPPKAASREEPVSKSSKPSKAKSKKEKVKGNKVPIDSLKQEDQPCETKELTQGSSDDDLGNLVEPSVETVKESADLSITNPKSKKSEKEESQADTQLPPSSSGKTSKKSKKKETVLPSSTPVNLPKPCKNIEIGLKRSNISADTVIISNYSSEEEMLDEKFESISLEEHTIKPDDPVVIKSHGVMSSIFDEHFKHPSNISEAELKVVAESTKGCKILVPETLLVEESLLDDKNMEALSVVESCLEIPCYVEKKSEESSKPMPVSGRGSKKSRKGKASNQKEDNQNLGKYHDSPSLLTASTCNVDKVTYVQSIEKTGNLSPSLSKESPTDINTVVSSNTLAYPLSDDQNNSEENGGEWKNQDLHLTLEEDTCIESNLVKLDSGTCSITEKTNIFDEDTSLSYYPEPIVDVKELQNEEPPLSSSSKMVEKPSKKRRGKKTKSQNQNTPVKEDVKVDNTPILSYASISKGASEIDVSISDTTDTISSRAPSNSSSGMNRDQYRDEFDHASSSVNEGRANDLYETTDVIENENQNRLVHEDSFSDNLPPQPDKAETVSDSEEIGSNLIMSENQFELSGDTDEPQAALQFELQSSNTQELHSLNEDFLSLTTEDLIPCDTILADEKEELDYEMKNGDETANSDCLSEALLASNLADSGSDFFIPHPLCNEDESGVDYVEITSMIVEDDLEPEESIDLVNILDEPKFSEDETTKDACEDFAESTTSKAEADVACEPITDVGACDETSAELAEKMSHVTAVDDPLQISELMPEADDLTAVSESCLPESAPPKKEVPPALSSKRNRKEKGRKGKGRR